MSPLLSDVVLEVGPLTFTETELGDVIGAAGRILLILVGSAIVVRVANRVIRRAVESVRNPDDGPIDRLKRRRRVWDDEVRTDAIAQARRVRRAEALSSVATSAVAVVVWTLAVFSVLATVGVNLGPYIAGLGIVGVALGFGAQDLVKDFISGVFMLLEDQYGVGDVVDTGEATGVVEGISLRTTRLRSVDGTRWYVPNGEIRRLGNMSQGWARALLDISVAYDTDVDHATAVIERVATEMATEADFEERFLADPEVWGVEALGADAVDIRLVIQTTPGDQWSISRELRRRLKSAFEAEGIEIPFPQRPLWVRNEATVAEAAEAQPDPAPSETSTGASGERRAYDQPEADEGAQAEDPDA